MPFIIGLAGSVAAGKSTTARVLKALLARWPSHPSVELVPTDGFLFPNARLEERGLMNRKGFPESYDLTKLLNFLADVKSGKDRVEAPVYSHLVYDVLPDQRLTHRAARHRHCRGPERAPARQAAEGRRSHSVRLGLLRFLDLYRCRRRVDRELVRRALPAAQADGVPRPRLLFPPLRGAVGGRGGAPPGCRSGARSISSICRRTSCRRGSAPTSSCAKAPTTRSRRWRSGSFDLSGYFSGSS